MAKAGRYGQQVDKPVPRNDVYTGLLAISLAGMLIGCLLLFLDYQQYDGAKPPKAEILKTTEKAPAKAAKSRLPIRYNEVASDGSDLVTRHLLSWKASGVS